MSNTGMYRPGGDNSVVYIPNTGRHGVQGVGFGQVQGYRPEGAINVVYSPYGKLGHSDIRELAGSISGVMRDAGVRFTEREENGAQVCRVYIPTGARPLIITARVALPGEVGAVFKGKFAKKARAVAKKVVKSKVLKKMARVIGPLASVIPGMQPLAMGIAAAAAAKKIVSAARKGNPKAAKFAKVAVKKLNTAVKNSRVSTYRVTGPEGSSEVVSL